VFVTGTVATPGEMTTGGCADADIVVLSPNLSARAAVVSGQIVHDPGGLLHAEAPVMSASEAVPVVGGGA
jgi:hypothetical protein